MGKRSHWQRRWQPERDRCQLHMYTPRYPSGSAVQWAMWTPELVAHLLCHNGEFCEHNHKLCYTKWVNLPGPRIYSAPYLLIMLINMSIFNLIYQSYLDISHDGHLSIALGASYFCIDPARNNLTAFNNNYNNMHCLPISWYGHYAFKVKHCWPLLINIASA